MKLNHSMRFLEEDDGGGSGGGGGEQAAVVDPPTGFFDDKGGFSPGWADRLPEDFVPAEDKTAFITHVSKYKTPLDVIKSDFHKERMLGKKANAITIPGEKATEEERAAFRKALGVPDTSDAYALKPENLPDGIEWDEAAMSDFAKIAHEHNVPASAMKALTERFLASQGAEAGRVQHAMTQRAEDDKKALQGEWKGDYGRNIDIATRAAKFVGVDVTSPGFSYPDVVKGFYELGKSLKEDVLIGADLPATMQPGKVRAKDIMTNSQNPLYAKYQEGDPETVALVRNLNRNG